MANPTTNYNWPMPTSTDLVTDLPADFALFGQPVDTSLKALNPETTLGDIAYRSSTSNTNTRLGIGSTGQVLTVASGVPSWATSSSGGMTLLSTTPLTGASTITISGILGTYKNLYVLIRDNSQAGAVRFNASTSLYFGIQMYANGATVTTTGESAAGNRLTAGAAPTGTANMSMTFLVNDYAGTVAMKPLLQYGIMSTGPGEMPLISIGGLNTTSAITSLAVVSDSGNWTAGEVLIYGVS